MKLPKPKASYTRVALLSLIFLVQIVWFVIIFTKLSEYSFWVNSLLTVFSLFMILYLVTKNESPAYRMSWIILITLFPIFGGLFYFLFGNKRPTRKMDEKLSERRRLLPYRMEDIPKANDLLSARDPRIGSLAQYIDDFADMPVYTNSEVEYFPSGEATMETLLADLESAKNYIFVEFFIIESGKMTNAIFDILKRKAAQGLDIRLIYDDYGCLMRLPFDFDKQMEAVGIKCLKFNPLKPNFSMSYNTRDHRKIIVIDSKVAYTGGINLADEYINVVERFGYWKDNVIKVTGPAIWNYTNLFLDMWNAFLPIDHSYDDFQNKQVMAETASMLEYPSEVEKSGFVQPFGDSPLDSEALGENVYRDILNIAEKYVYIYTPYLVISYELQTAMTLAAKRGVDVRLMTPGIPDKKLVYRMTRSYYQSLLEEGVKIYEYTPGFLHAKTFVSDDKIATVGTINLDYRSLYLHFETSTMLYFHPTIKTIKKDFLESQAVAREIFIRDTHTSFIGQIWEALLRLLAPFV